MSAYVVDDPVQQVLTHGEALDQTRHEPSCVPTGLIYVLLPSACSSARPTHPQHRSRHLAEAHYAR